MKTVAVRLHGTKDLRLDTYNLPEISDNEILARVVTDSVCMSTYKAFIQGSQHKRVPKDIENNPVVVGHEFCGEIIKVGKKWTDKYREGSKFVIQPALNYNGSLFAPGYSYEFIGGSAQYVIIPNEVMETDNLIMYESDTYFTGSLSEPMSCIIGAFNANYHTVKENYNHIMGCKPNGKMLILAGCGPMGIGAIDYALNGLTNPPSLLVVTDIDENRVNEAKQIFKGKKTRLEFLNLSDKEKLLLLTDNTGFDDIFVFAPVPELLELASNVSCEDGCINFFAGPTKNDFSAFFNFYNVHYSSIHIVGTSGGNKNDMLEAVKLMESKAINPSVMITHIGGIDSVIETIENLPNIEGAKKLIYTGFSLPLTAIKDFESKGKEENEFAPIFSKLAEICARNNGIWNREAEQYLLNNGIKIEV